MQSQFSFLRLAVALFLAESFIKNSGKLSNGDEGQDRVGEWITFTKYVCTHSALLCQEKVPARKTIPVMQNGTVIRN